VVWGAVIAFLAANLLSYAVVAISGASTESDQPLPPPVFFFSIVVVSGTFAIFSLLFARGAPEGLARRLLLVRPNIPRRLLWLLLPATWGVWMAGTPLALLGKWLFGDSDALLNFTRSYSSGPWAWKIAFLAASTLGPGIGEELLFRGWLQNGLRVSRGPRFALIFTALAFAACHLPPARVLFILPLGFWLGFLALRTGSLVPGILCHVFVNLTGHLLLATDVDEAFVFSIAIAVGIPSFVIVVRLFRRLRREESRLAAGPPTPGQIPASSMPADDA
jgi:membrane protease YdiL (CAAX protease family)